MPPTMPNMPTCETEFVTLFKAWKQNIHDEDMLYNMIGHWAFRWKESIYAKDEIDDLCTRLDDGDEHKRIIIEDVLDGGGRYKYIRMQCLINSGLYTESNSDDDSDDYEATDDDDDSEEDDEESEEDDEESDDESDRGRFRPN